MGEQGVQEGAEHAPLWSPCVYDQLIYYDISEEEQGYPSVNEHSADRLLSKGMARHRQKMLSIDPAISTISRSYDLACSGLQGCDMIYP